MVYHDYCRGSIIGEEGVGIRNMYPITDPLFIIVNIIIYKIKNRYSIQCHNITLITEFQINIFYIE